MKLSLSDVRKYNAEMASQGTSAFDSKAIKDVILDDKESFYKDIAELRSSKRTNKAGKTIPPATNSFSEFITERYGIGATKEELTNDKFVIVKKYLKQLGVETHRYTLSDLGDQLGIDNLTKSAVENLLSTDIASGSTFIIREVFTEAIRLGMLNNTLHPNWIIRTQPLADLEVTSPQIKRGNAAVKFIEEGESIEFGTVQFGQKKISVRKIGTGIELTDELVMRSSIDMLVEYVMTVGEDMGLGADYLAVAVLKNGEQADLSESAPIIGSESGTAIAWKDMVRVSGRMRRLGNVPNVIITQEEEGLNVNLIDEIKGYDGVRLLTQLQNQFSMLPSYRHDLHGNTASGTAIFLSSSRCMLKHTFRPMMTERRRNPKTQKEEIYFSDWIGFSIVRRDARVIVNKAVAFSGNGFPSYMDVDAYQNSPFSE